MSTANLNALRIIIRNAQYKVKALTWDEDFQLSQTANNIWDKLDDIFKILGPFPDDYRGETK